MTRPHRQRPPPSPRAPEPQTSDEPPYNIIPFDKSPADHPFLRFPEVRAATAALRVGNLRKPSSWQPHNVDIFDWLGAFFGFQSDNVSNQREHLVLHLANCQMSQELPPIYIETLDYTVVGRFRRKLFRNYFHWCSFLGCKSSILISKSHGQLSDSEHHRELLYVALYLLIWGESANLRFMPECICYIFHHMAMELNRVLGNDIDENTGRVFVPSTSGKNAFLNRVVKPIYDMVKAEVDKSNNGTAPYSNWRNYDDINEYFWSTRCFDEMKWPIDINSDFFVTTSDGKRIRKTGFVEQRSFLNLLWSFDRLWIMLFLFLQAAIIVAWKDGTDHPWQALHDEDIQARVLSVFVTWSSMRFLKTLLDAVMQYKLVSKETSWLGVRIVLKIIVSTVWMIIFAVFYARIWNQKKDDRGLSVVTFLEVAFVFTLPKVLEPILFMFPWVRNFFENTNWRIVYVITWWFQSKTFVGGGVGESVLDSLKYYVFWTGVLVTKFCFSYFLQIKPMIQPTKDLFKLTELRYKWHEFFGNSNRFAVGFLWLPVVLIYLMDMQIWYSIFSSFVGAGVGLFGNLGEIRNVQQLKLRFQSFAGAMQFNVMSQERYWRINKRLMIGEHFLKKFIYRVNRLMLRYGLGIPFKKLESNQVELAHKFGLIWNEIIMTFREEDIVSDKEVELLELPQDTWNVKIVQWPCFLLLNEVYLAISQAIKLFDAGDRLRYKIEKNEYRRCSVIESYESVRHLLLTIIKCDTREHSAISILFKKIDTFINLGLFTSKFDMKVLIKIHNILIALISLLIKHDKNVNEVVKTLQELHEVFITRFYKPDSLDPGRGLLDTGLLFENAVKLPDPSDQKFYRQARRLYKLLTVHDSMKNIPVNLEARRRIAFFSNSLFMKIPHAPTVQKMMAFSVLTPYYEEDVLYKREQLQFENEDGVSTLYYLQTIYPDEWVNFLERMRREGMVSEDELWTTKLRDLRLWASYRGQTLARTVRGMMYHYRALKMLDILDSVSEMDININAKRTPSEWSALFKCHGDGTLMMKYTYVVSCQIYGTQKAAQDPHADEILNLMKDNEALRVAYVDEVSTRAGTEYYSVLVKYDKHLGKEVEVYRLQLPGPLKIGEGKPENQNHALVFTRGEAVQTIDMNQDNYFEETLKMRNLLEEYKVKYGIHKPKILGVREHIFTGSVSTLAWFMSAQETSFVTLGQRVLAKPLKIRLHYGHPDVFDRFWFLTRGGISKASKLINLSEDIFAGFNCTLRGGNVTHHEYIQVGKGRDVGLNQVSMFEAKVASGNGEQVLSRDVYRLGQRLDFFRMLSFFYTTVEFFFNTMMVSLTIYAFLWSRLYLALSGVESSVAGNAKTNKALATILNQQFLVQLGVLTVLPMIFENTLEFGLVSAVWDFIIMQLQLSSVFYTFSLGTRSHYFGRTILHGGAKYRPTGRGFVVHHTNFAENYRLYARSHFIKAIELGLILIVYAGYSPVAKGTLAYTALTISSWFLVVSWLMAPFLFNPSGFDWLKTLHDFGDFMSWIQFQGSVFAKPEESWECWWKEEHDHLRTTGLWGKLLEIILDLRFFFFQYGLVYQLGISAGSKSIVVYMLSRICMGGVLLMYFAIVYARDRYSTKKHVYYRLVQFLVFVLGILIVIALMQVRLLDILTSLLACLPTGWGLLLIAQVFRPILEKTMIWGTVISVARMYDTMFGLIVWTPLMVLSWLPGSHSMQTRILFNEAFSRGLGYARLLLKRKPKVK